MKYADFEKALLKLGFETDVRLAPATVAYHLDVPVDEAKRYLEQLLSTGAVQLESDDEGNLYYELPHRPARGVTGPVLSQHSAEVARRRRGFARLMNGIVPGLGSLLQGYRRHGGAQLALFGTSLLLFVSYWNDFGDDEHRIWAILLIATMFGTWIWAQWTAVRGEDG